MFDVFHLLSFCPPLSLFFRDLPFEGKIALLDVGSCHNSFEKFDDFFSVVGIDLYPAVEVMFLVLAYLYLNISLLVNDKNLSKLNCVFNVIFS